MTTFGRIITDDQVEDAVMATLRRWIHTELNEVERQVLGVASEGYYQRPICYTVKASFDKFPEEELPMVLVVSTGATPGGMDGRRQHKATFVVGVACVVSSTSEDDSRRYAYRLGAAIRAALEHNQSLDGALDGTVTGVNWDDGKNNELPEPDGGQRTIWTARQVFSVDVSNVLTRNAGPSAPEPDPPNEAPPHGDWPTVADHEITYQGVQTMEEEGT